MADFTVRDATPDDAAACAAIYEPYVTGTAITFEEVAPTAAEMATRIIDAQAAHAWLVLDDPDRGVIGYAYAGPFAKRAAYRWATEVSVYLHPAAGGRGGGRALYEALFPLLLRRGFRIAMACMTLPNDASVGLHRSFGFETVATYPDVGWKLGAWHTTAWMQKRLAPADEGEPLELR
ncbi:GNAT family N-acetyltransferase [Frondihabitans australicus]|uniref:Phosphinothricin acetyltransferase n=1 Tax=Frondihabitans australicus TaxID=386892 RepID=A0A495IAM1_9MICO|nr:GNAT family N-acetyltransferase [Frondihabitans australicus]RKR72962.1 phosphinothricin acetyltransferase [Frondihabitans australicus]